MTENLPEPHEGEYIDGEIVEGDIWESCTLHHTRRCLACFPHQPWHKQVDPMVDLLFDMEAVRNQVFKDLFGSFEHTEKLMEQVYEQERQMRCRMAKRWITLWCFLAPFYAILGAVDFMSGAVGAGLLFMFLVGFSVWMIRWNHGRLKELQRGRS